MTASCRACGAAIVWARTINDRPIPLDAEPNPAGNVILDGTTAHVLGGDGQTIPFELAHLADADRHMPHHATCTEWGKR